MAHPPVEVLVSVADDRLVELSTVVAALRAAGLAVDGVLEALGVVTGSIAADAVDSLRAVPGVAAVEVQRAVGFPPA